jgi:iron complex outermembrane receptor protein
MSYRPQSGTSSRTAALLLASAAAVVWAGPAAAQTSSPGQETQIGDPTQPPRDGSATPADPGDQTTTDAGGIADVVVTAERRETRLQDTPISITALTADSIEAQGVRNVLDLSSSVPNLTTTTGPQGSADANFFIRGVGQLDFIATNDPAVGVYVDGVYLGRTVGALLDAGNIARVEVLRGPQGTLFGRNTLGGAVSITTKQPTLGEYSSSARFTFGNFDRFEADGDLNIPLGDDAAFRVYGFGRQADGFARRRLDGQDFGRIDRHGFQAQLLVQPSDRFTANLSVDYSLDTSNPAPSVLLAAAPLPFFPADLPTQIQDPDDFYAVNSSNLPFSRNQIWGATANLALELSDTTTLRSISSYRQLRAFSTSDPDGSLYRLYDQRTPTQQDQFSQEIQLSGSLAGGRLEYLLGGYYFFEETDQTLFLCFAPITPRPQVGQFFNQCNTWNQGNKQDTYSAAAFGQLRYSFTDRFSVTLGGRYTNEVKRNISNQAFDFRPAGLFIPPPGPGIVVPGFLSPIVSNLPGRLKFERFTPKVGFEFKPNTDVLIFGSYAQGFRSGGFNGRLITPQTSIPTYAPDLNDTFELGIKSDIARGLRFNATAFYTKYKDIQQTISVPDIQFRVANAGEAELYGLEAELTAIPVDRLIINAGFGYTKSEFKEVVPGAPPIVGNQLPFAPEVTANVGVEYGIDLGNAGRLTPRVDARYQSRVFFTALNLPLEQQEPYTLVRARLTYNDPADRFSVSAFVDNLTDEEFYTFGQNALGAQGVAYNYLGRPREYGVTVAARF